jgi:hypothetical protein
MSRSRRGEGGALPPASPSGEQHRNHSGQEDTIKSSRTSDGGYWRSQVSNPV